MYQAEGVCNRTTASDASTACFPPACLPACPCPPCRPPSDAETLPPSPPLEPSLPSPRPCSPYSRFSSAPHSPPAIPPCHIVAHKDTVGTISGEATQEAGLEHVVDKLLLSLGRCD